MLIKATELERRFFSFEKLIELMSLKVSFSIPVRHIFYIIPTCHWQFLAIKSR